MKDPVAAIRQITHPDEGPCPLCGHIFDTHKDGCPYGAIDAALAPDRLRETPFDDHEAIAEVLHKMGWNSPCDAQWDHLRGWCKSIRLQWLAALAASPSPGVRVLYFAEQAVRDASMIRESPTDTAFVRVEPSGGSQECICVNYFTSVTCPVHSAGGSQERKP